MMSDLSLSTLQAAIPVTVVIAALSLIGFLIFVVQKQRLGCWVCMAGLIANLAICYVSIRRLEDVYARIARHESFSGKSKSYLLSQLGRPSSTKPYTFKGQQCEDWIYEIDILGPKVRVQFGFENENVTGAGYASND
jgi:hypothetical protein